MIFRNMLFSLIGQLHNLQKIWALKIGHVIQEKGLIGVLVLVNHGKEIEIGEEDRCFPKDHGRNFVQFLFKMAHEGMLIIATYLVASWNDGIMEYWNHGETKKNTGDSMVKPEGRGRKRRKIVKGVQIALKPFQGWRDTHLLTSPRPSYYS